MRGNAHSAIDYRKREERSERDPILLLKNSAVPQTGFPQGARVMFLVIFLDFCELEILKYTVSNMHFSGIQHFGKKDALLGFRKEPQDFVVSLLLLQPPFAERQ
jgi:hypothetical protein